MPKPKSPRAPSLTLHLRESLFPSLMLPTRTVRLYNKMNDNATRHLSDLKLMYHINLLDVDSLGA